MRAGQLVYPYVSVCSHHARHKIDLSALGTGGASADSREGVARGEGSVAGVTTYCGVGGDDNRELNSPVAMAGTSARAGGHAREWGRGTGRRGVKRSAQGMSCNAANCSGLGGKRATVELEGS